jgi:hypothetical protein
MKTDFRFNSSTISPDLFFFSLFFKYNVDSVWAKRGDDASLAESSDLLNNFTNKCDSPLFTNFLFAHLTLPISSFEIRSDRIEE